MPAAPSQFDLPGKNLGAGFLPWALLALIVCFIAISSQSLWIDEAFMASKAAQPTLADWWHTMPKGSGSDLQMPLYMIYMWAFAKIFGLSEWTLRAANIPWFVAGVAAFIPAFPKSQRLAAAAVTLLCPFAWFYLNEARPYAMQLGSSLVIFAALYRLSDNPPPEPRNERNWTIAFWLGVIVLCGSSLLGVLWAGAAFLALPLLFSWKRLLQLLRTHWFACLLSCAILAALSGYYIWTIKFGAHALNAENQQAGNSTLTAVQSAAHFRQGFAGGSKLENSAFAIYELLGFSGLGPGKLEIRTAKLAAFRHFIPQLALFAVALFTLLLLAAGRLLRPRPASDASPSPLNGDHVARSAQLHSGNYLVVGLGSHWAGVRGENVHLQQPTDKIGKRIALAFVAVLPMLLLLAAGSFLGFLVLGRHCTPLMPGLLFVLTLGLVSASSQPHWIFKLLVAGFLILSLCSCLSLRFARRHEKDDYRDAAQTANAALARGQSVWWSAADDGAVYYHLPLSGVPGIAGAAILVLNPTPQSLSALPPPDLVITSKPDLYDNQEAVAKYVRNNPYQQVAAFPAFTVWQRKTGIELH
jgi:hypothetical protein